MSENFFLLTTALFFVQIREQKYKAHLDNLIWLVAIILNLYLIK